MTKLYYVVETDDPTIPLCKAKEAPFPWFTHDVLEARFFAYTMNIIAKANTYQVKEFAPTAYLGVPYKPQWTPTANVRRGDCGPACIAMIVPFLTIYIPTVDQAAASCGQSATGSGSLYTNHAQLRQGAAAYDVTLVTRSPYRKPQLDMELLEESLEAGLPSIALIHYGVLRDETNKRTDYVKNQDQNYDRGHWVVVIGMDKKDVYIHDPDFYGTREQDGNARAVPRFAFFEALKTVAPGCSVGFQGLIVEVT
jgi:hypothetical protein